MAIYCLQTLLLPSDIRQLILSWLKAEVQGHSKMVVNWLQGSWMPMWKAGRSTQYSLPSFSWGSLFPDFSGSCRKCSCPGLSLFAPGVAGGLIPRALSSSAIKNSFGLYDHIIKNWMMMTDDDQSSSNYDQSWSNDDDIQRRLKQKCSSDCNSLAF